jgi:hypothetical protein
LIPGEEYTFIGHLNVEKGESAFLGVRFPDGSESTTPPVTDSTIPFDFNNIDSTKWRRCRLSFIPPEGVTSVEVFARRTSSGEGLVHVDDFGLVRQSGYVEGITRSRLEDASLNVSIERGKRTGRNLIENYAFENGDFLSPWKISDGAGVKQSPGKSPTTSDTTNDGMGEKSIELSAANGEVYQQINDLTSGEEYTFAGHVKGGIVFMGVRFPDGFEFIGPQVSVSGGNWKRCSLSFRVPEGVTTVEVFARRTSSAKGVAYVDDFALVQR